MPVGADSLASDDDLEGLVVIPLDPAYVFVALGLVAGLVAICVWQRGAGARERRKNRPRRNKGRDLLPTDEPEPDEEEQLGEAEAEDGKSARTSDDTFMGFKKKLKPSKARKSEEGNVRL